MTVCGQASNDADMCPVECPGPLEWLLTSMGSREQFLLGSAWKVPSLGMAQVLVKRLFVKFPVRFGYKSQQPMINLGPTTFCRNKGDGSLNVPCSFHCGWLMTALDRMRRYM